MLRLLRIRSMKIRFLACLAVLFAALSPIPASAQATLFFDFFLFDNAGQPANDYNAFFQWDVTAGTVDLVGGNVPGSDDDLTGRYVDLAGSAGDPGRFATRLPINFMAGVTYNLSFVYTNSGGTGNMATATIGGNVFNVTATSTYPNFQTFSQNFTFAANTSASLVFQDLGVGADNFGVGIDRVRINQVVVPGENPPETIYGVTTARELVTFQSDSPQILTSSIPITGLTGQASGESIIGIDFRPATGQLLCARECPGESLPALHNQSRETVWPRRSAPTSPASLAPPSSVSISTLSRIASAS